MIDLETFGTTPGSVIRSIGAIEFDPYKPGVFGNTFYQNINSESQEKLGQTKDQTTVDWWARQDKAAQEVLEPDQKDCFDVLKLLRAWYKDSPAIFLWSQGSNFDGVLLENLFRKCDIKVPWVFYNTRDTRTAYQMGKVNTKAIPFEGQPHNALDDSKHQARLVQEAFKRIGWLDYK